MRRLAARRRIACTVLCSAVLASGTIKGLILTLTINPAIDRNVTVDRLVFDDRAYILSRAEAAGGRGINASRVIHNFGGKTLAIATCGGRSGYLLEQFLSRSGFATDLVPIQNEIRTNMTVSDRQGLSVKMNERGPALTETELELLESTVKDHLSDAEWLMICGSQPPGVPASFYAKLIDMAAAHKVKVLLDADGESLTMGIEAGPTVVTPNQQEAERLLDRALLTRSNFLDAAAHIRKMGAQAVVLSLGSRGAVAASGDQTLEAVPPRVEAVCPIGAGDALAAAFTWAMEETGGKFEEAVRWGVAAGTASAMLPGVSFPTMEQTRKILPQVELRSVG